MPGYAGDRKIALSLKTAQNCEDAKEVVCRCRCGGALHGAKRGSVMALALDDPHSPSRICPRCNGKRETVFHDRFGGDPIRSKCDKCGGTGRVLPKEKT